MNTAIIYFRIILLIFIIGQFTNFELSKVNHACRIGLIILVILDLFKLIETYLRSKKLNESIKTALISISFILSILFLVEIIFMFIPRTHAVGYTNASKLWTKFHWKPINKFGYRDIDLAPDGKKETCFFIGDSFTAGFGIKKADNRFSNLFAKKKDNVNVYNLGINAIDTGKEFMYMNEFIDKTNIIPDKIFLQYYGNDIDESARRNNVNFKGFTPHSNVPSFLNSFVRGSYLLDYLYWLFPRNDSANYWEFLEEAYNSEKALNDHYADLDKFIDFSKKNSSEMVVILFPFLQDLEGSKKLYTEKIKTFFESKGVKVIDVTELVRDLPLSKVLVNNNDAHASKLVNQLIADELLKIE